jgi:hypothetical protein
MHARLRLINEPRANGANAGPVDGGFTSIHCTDFVVAASVSVVRVPPCRH